VRPIYGESGNRPAILANGEGNQELQFVKERSDVTLLGVPSLYMAFSLPPCRIVGLTARARKGVAADDCQ
jgi:hypothetical protein